ncbi:unnamed protein product, partial [Ectocarpus sp. 13 AM-2016]
PLEHAQVPPPRRLRARLLRPRAAFPSSPLQRVELPPASESVARALVPGTAGGVGPVEEGVGADLPGEAGRARDAGARAGAARAILRPHPP